MSESARLTLDNPVFAGRLRVPKNEQPAPAQQRSNERFDEQVQSAAGENPLEVLSEPVWRRPLSERTVPSVPTNSWAEVQVTSNEPHHVQLPQSYERVTSTEQPLSMVSSQISTAELPAQKRYKNPLSGLRFKSPKYGYTKLQTALVVMAGLIFLLGIGVSLQAFLANKHVTAQVAALSKKDAAPSNGSVPSTNKPSASAFSNYAVAPDLPRYIKIPKLGVSARVLQVGVTSSGALATPSNVFDTAWYTGSAKPGQPGATLIDGHVSSWTTHGVFYGLKNLRVGDQIQIQRGDGQILNYQVVKSQTYSDTNVDMKAAMTPVVAGKSGLNLITCTGQVKPGTNEFNQRVIVFAEQI